MNKIVELSKVRKERRSTNTNSKETLECLVSNLKNEMLIRSETENPSDSFWKSRPTKDFPPSSIRSPSEYEGSDYINISCTQTELKYSEQKKLVENWCSFLPKQQNIKFIWFSSRLPQNLFEAICEVEDLVGLNIHWSGIKSFDSITKLKSLKYLSIGSSPSLSPLEHLNELKNLEWLELENIRALKDLSFLQPMKKLKGLSIGGSISSKIIKAKSLEPLTKLQDLYWLSLNSFATEDNSLSYLAHLKRLKYLSISGKFPMEEYAKLNGLRPEIECDAFTPFLGPYGIFCKKCNQENEQLKIIGKGGPWLCPSCDSERLKKYIVKYNDIVASHKYLNNKS